METLTSCPICDATEQTLFLTCRDHVVSKKNFSIVQCGRCGFKFTNPRPLENEIAAFYQSEDYISHSNTSKGLVSKIYQVVRKYTLKKKMALINSLSARGQILDIGCGTGEFLNRCKEDGWKATGIEPGEQARKFGRETYGIDVREPDALKNLPDGAFQIVTMWHVLEHVHRLADTVENLKRLLSKDGTLLIAVPNCTSLDAKIYGENWLAYEVPRHLYHFAPKDIRALFNRHGMNVLQVLPMRFDSFYCAIVSEKYISNGRFRPFRAFYNGLRSNLAASGTNRETCSSQLYIIRRND